MTAGDMIPQLTYTYFLLKDIVKCHGWSESRSPALPIDCFSSIDESTFGEINRLKEEGSESFKAGDLDQALSK